MRGMSRGLGEGSDRLRASFSSPGPGGSAPPAARLAGTTGSGDVAGAAGAAGVGTPAAVLAGACGGALPSATSLAFCDRRVRLVRGEGRGVSD